MGRVLGGDISLRTSDHQLIALKHRDNISVGLVSVRQFQSEAEGQVGATRKVRRNEHVVDTHSNWCEPCCSHFAQPFSPRGGGATGETLRAAKPAGKRFPSFLIPL